MIGTIQGELYVIEKLSKKFCTSEDTFSKAKAKILTI